MPEVLSTALMQRALLAAVLVGVTAPSVGIYLVQRRLALLGDGIGHVALTGVALGVLTGTSPLVAAVVVAILGAVALELIRERGRTSGDVALAILFYGGIAGGVVLIGLSDDGSTANLNAFLFGQLAAVPPTDVALIAGLALAVLAVTLGLSRQLFTVCQDEEYARVTGLPVRLLNILLAVTAAVTVTVGLRVVGVLLVSALMVVPVATAQQLSRGFRTTFAAALAIGVACSVAGVVTSYYAETAPGASIVLLAIAAFLVAAAIGGVRQRVARRAATTAPNPHGVDLTAALPGDGGSS